MEQESKYNIDSFHKNCKTMTPRPESVTVNKMIDNKHYPKQPRCKTRAKLTAFPLKAQEGSSRQVARLGDNFSRREDLNPCQLFKFYTMKNLK